MKSPRLVILLLLAMDVVHLQAQDKAVPAPSTGSAQTEMQKCIATTDAEWQAAFKRDVTAVHEAELNKVKLLFLMSLDEAFKKAGSAADLEGAGALRNEQKRFGDTNGFLERDDAAAAASVKQLRAAIRLQLARVEKEHAARTKALHAKIRCGARTGADAAHAAAADR